MRVMSASVLVPAPKVPSVDARLAEIRCLLTFVDERDVPKSVVTLIRAQLLVPVSAMTVLPSCVAGPAVNATAPVMAPVPKALEAPPLSTSTLVMSSGSNGRLSKW